MRTLNETDAFMEAKERYRFEGTKRYDIEKLDAFLDGFEFADKQIKPICLLFSEWVSWRGWHLVLITNPHTWNHTTGVTKTTEELFELFLEEQTKK